MTSDYDKGEQPISRLIDELGLSRKQIVEASTENITFKMVDKACKGRRLTPNVQQKILNALNAASGKTFSLKDLFNY